MRFGKLLVAIIGLVIVVTILLLHILPRSIDVVWRIEYPEYDGQPYMLEVTPDGRVYSLQFIQGKLQLRVYGSDGRPLRVVPIPEYYGAAIISIEKAEPVYMQFMVDEPDPIPNPNTLWLAIDKDGKIKFKTVNVRASKSMIDVHVVPTHKYVYSTGGTGDNYLGATVVKMDYTGLRHWIRFDPSCNGYYGPATVDNKGNIIMIGDIGSGAGPFILKYSPDGRQLWKSKHLVSDGSQAIWVRANNLGQIYTIYNLHMGNMSESCDDTSGRSQDYMLSLYNPGGELLRTTRLSHGAWLNVMDAAINVKGDIIVVGNRKTTSLLGYPVKDDNVQLIKTNAKGNILWSRTVVVPAGYLVWHIKLDDRGGIYLIGGTDNADIFVYKVMDPK